MSKLTIEELKAKIKLKAEQKAEREAFYAEHNAEVVSDLGYTRGQLQEAFNFLKKGMSDWKDPICKDIPKDKLVIMREACSFFTGSFLDIYREKKNSYRVYAEGYYNAMVDPDMDYDEDCAY